MAKKTDTNDLLESLASNVSSPEELASAVAMLKKRALERMLEEEMAEHLGYEKHANEGFDGGNSRNGRTKKTVLTNTGAVELDVPRDREGSFSPKAVPKGNERHDASCRDA